MPGRILQKQKPTHVLLALKNEVAHQVCLTSGAILYEDRNSDSQKKTEK